jgi:hypothetical protein
LPWPLRRLAGRWSLVRCRRAGPHYRRSDILWRKPSWRWSVTSHNIIMHDILPMSSCILKDLWRSHIHRHTLAPSVMTR